jgi:putative ABC transport system ATP-binding protein
MISIRKLQFRYPKSDFHLSIDELDIKQGEKVAIIGPSGSGKTTLLNLLAGISVPDSGELCVGDVELNALSDSQRRNFRISRIGLVFQQFELIDYLTARDNILLPYAINRSLYLSDAIRQEAEARAAAMGLGDKLWRRPQKLSQGEQQRVAICRALINRPEIILADEPTGNLDPANKKLILQILFEQVTTNVQTLIVVTHDHGILTGFDRTVDFTSLVSHHSGQPSSPFAQVTQSTQSVEAD